jgi:hypothetical protein
MAWDAGVEDSVFEGRLRSFCAAAGSPENCGIGTVGPLGRKVTGVKEWILFGR